MDEAEDEIRTAANASALGLAVNAARADSGMTEEASTLLREQARLARMQADQLGEDARLTRWSLRLRHASAIMRFAFELAIAFVLVAVASALATAMWSAAHDNGLVIEAFSVPPDFVGRGLSGEVVATRLLDKLARMQEETNSIRPADTYRNNWGDDIKVEIPNTGISIGELNRYLRSWLGRETHITGEIYRTPSGIAVTARARDPGNTFVGNENDLDQLLQKAAESIYAVTQPYRYAAFLNEKGRDGEAVAALRKLAAGATPAERAWALSLLGNLYGFYGKPEEALGTLRAGVAADPTNAHAWDNLSSGELTLDRLEDAWRHTRQALELYDKGSVAFDPGRVEIIKLQDKSFLAATLGDYISAEAMDEAIRRLPDQGGTQEQATVDEAVQAAYDHDLAKARGLVADIHPANTNERINLWFQSSTVAFLAQDWRRLDQLLDRDALLGIAPANYRPVLQSIFVRQPTAGLAEGRALQGDITGARRLVAATPLDCYNCVDARGNIEAAARNWNGAAYWFGRAARDAPSIPTALYDWGMMLLAKGDTAGAITKFASAAEKGPHYADPLEGWGEALIRENRSDLAEAKFELANPFAPNWGRLHLAWGEALFWLGRTKEARAQWALAVHLDLNAQDRATLAKFRSTQKPFD